MPGPNRYEHVPDVVPHGDEFLASSDAYPGVYGECTTREEAIDNFWECVDFIGELARQPDWPHDRSPYVEEWETFDDDGALPWRAGDDKEEPA